LSLAKEKERRQRTRDRTGR